MSGWVNGGVTPCRLLQIQGENMYSLPTSFIPEMIMMKTRKKEKSLGRLAGHILYLWQGRVQDFLKEGGQGRPKDRAVSKTKIMICYMCYGSHFLHGKTSLLFEISTPAQGGWPPTPCILLLTFGEFGKVSTVLWSRQDVSFTSARR